MRILHICRNLAGSTVFPQMFDAVAELGIPQLIFAPEDKPQNLGRNIPEHVETHYALTLRKTDPIFFFRKWQRSLPEVRKLDLSGVTMIHGHTLFTAGSIAMRLAGELGVPYMLTVRYSDLAAIWKYEPHLRPLARQVLRGASRVVFLNEKARQQVLKGWVKGEEAARISPRTAVIPNGISDVWLDGQSRRNPGEKVVVGFAGLMNARKRPLDALSAVHAAGEKYAMLACGTGALAEEMQRRMRPGDRYLGRISGTEAMKEFYRSCDILLVPSVAETFGMVYLEAMSQGLPVLYTRDQGFDGQFPEGEVGYSVESGNIEEQAAMIRRIAEGDYARMSRNCVEHASAFRWEVIAQRWRELYQSVEDEK